MSASQAGYATLFADATPLLSPYTNGAELPGGDRGACLRQGQQARPSSGLQRSNALTAGGDNGWAVTLPNAARGLSFAFENSDSVSIDIYPVPTPGYFGAYVPLDTIGGKANSEAYSLAAGANVTFACSENHRWVTS